MKKLVHVKSVGTNKFNSHRFTRTKRWLVCVGMVIRKMGQNVFGS